MNFEKVYIVSNLVGNSLRVLNDENLVGVTLNIQAIPQLSGESLNITLSGIPYSIRITRF